MAKKPIQISGNLTYDEAIKAIRSMKGTRSIIGDEIPELCTVKHITTRVPTFDYLGSLVEGRVTILAGKTGSGKSTLSLTCVAAIIRRIKASGQTKFVLWFDSEGAYDSAYARALGIDERYMIIKRGRVMEECFKEASDLIEMGIIEACVFDSLDSMISRKQEDNAFENTMGGMAGAFSAHFPLLYNKIIEHNVTTIIIKQARVKMGYTGGAEVITFSGGYALRHFADSIFMVNRLSNRNLDYQPIQIKAEKTRSPRMGLVLDIPLGMQGHVGVDIVRDLVNLGINHGVITSGGGGWTTLTLNDGTVIREQGVDKFINVFKTNDEYSKELENYIYDNVINISSMICMSRTEGEDLAVDYGQEEQKTEE